MIFPRIPPNTRVSLHNTRDPLPLLPGTALTYPGTPINETISLNEKQTPIGLFVIAFKCDSTHNLDTTPQIFPLISEWRDTSKTVPVLWIIENSMA